MTWNGRIVSGGFALAVCLLMVACVETTHRARPYSAGYGTARDTDNYLARADIHGTNRQDILGTAVFRQTRDGVEVRLNVRGLSPGRHGVHIHAGGSCGDDGSEAGGHFDPHHTGSHGGPDQPSAEHHAGDLGNIPADSTGHAAGMLTSPALRVQPGSGLSVIGRTIVIHAKPDNLTDTPPLGGSGARVACGIIRSAR